MGPNSSGYGYYGEQKKKFPVKFVALGLGVVILLVVIIVVLSSLASRNSIGTQSQHLGARLGNLTALTKDATTHLTNGDLLKLNAETSLVTDGVPASLGGVLPSKLDKSIQSSEADTTDTQTLQSAALAGTYDSAYKQVLNEKLDSITALLSEMYTKTTSKTTREALNEQYKNYQAIETNLQKVTI